MNDLSDVDLLRKMRLGDKNAFVALYRRHHSAVYRYALMRCTSLQNACDVVQEVFLGLMQDKYHFDPLKGELLYFLFGVARFIAMKWDAKSYVVDDMQDEDDVLEVACEAAGPLDVLLNTQKAEELRAAIACLAPHYRDVLILYELQEMSYEEIAQICQISLGTVRSRLSRARAALATRLSK